MVSNYLWWKNQYLHYFTQGISFTEYIHKMNDPEKCKGAMFWLQPQADWIMINGDVKADFIGRFEDLQRDFDKACDRIGVEKQQLPHMNKHTGLRKHYYCYYDSETRDIIARLHKKDIDLFCYEFEKPSKRYYISYYASAAPKAAKTLLLKYRFYFLYALIVKLKHKACFFKKRLLCMLLCMRRSEEIFLTRFFELSEDIVYQASEGETIVFNRNGDELFSLNETAAEILACIGERKPLESLLTYQTEKYDKKRRRLKADIMACAQQLWKDSVIKVRQKS
jgi:hypothetical protein